MTTQEIVLLLYNIALVPVIFFSFLLLLLTLIHLLLPKKNMHHKELIEPSVTVQIPSFNDSIAARCIEACLKFKYKKLQIMILDDSTDEKTQKLLKAYESEPRVEYIHRTNRNGYKPGALKDAMHKVKGEIIVIFDADFVPQVNFIEKIVQPFADKKVALVQAGQGFLNTHTNLITKFASYLLMTLHTIIMPINDKINTVFFCGTAGAIRKSALLASGGWNTKSITEDSDLTVRMLAKGYKTVYMPFDTPSEVPETFEAFFKQQMRWCFGGVRVFYDHMKLILHKSKLTIAQRFMITYLTMGNLVGPAVILLTIAGMSGWFFGDPKLFTINDALLMILKIIVTIGFLVMGFVMLVRRSMIREFPQLILATISIGILLSFANSYAVYRATFHKDKPLFSKSQGSWVCTPKGGNARYK